MATATEQAAPDLLSVVTQLQAQIAELRAELAASKPKFVKMPAPALTRSRRRTYVPSEQLRQQAMRSLARGQTAGGQSRWLDTPQGRETVPDEYRPVFFPGDLVRINPDAEIWGEPGHTWAERLADPLVKNSDGIGEIQGCMYLDNSWQPKYKVDMPGGLPHAYRESELLPCE